MPRIKSKKFTHIFVSDYIVEGIVKGTKCNIIEVRNYARNAFITVETELRQTIVCFSHSIEPI